MNELIFKNKKYAYEQYGNNSLLVILNTHNQGEKYFGYASLTKNPKSDLLFITDPNNSYYLDNDNGETYKELLINISEKYDKKRITIFGTSMAGYAALYFGSQLGFNIITSNPQIDLDVSYEISWPNLRETLSKIENKISLKTFISNNYRGGNIFIIYGQHRMDIANYKLFCEIDFGEKLIIKKHINSIEHGFFLRLETLHEIQFLLENIENRIEYNIPEF